jgi:hypothetical protein
MTGPQVPNPEIEEADIEEVEEDIEEARKGERENDTFPGTDDEIISPAGDADAPAPG